MTADPGKMIYVLGQQVRQLEQRVAKLEKRIAMMEAKPKRGRPPKVEPWKEQRA